MSIDGGQRDLPLVHQCEHPPAHSSLRNQNGSLQFPEHRSGSVDTSFSPVGVASRDPWFFVLLYFVAIALGSSNVWTRSREPMPRYYFHFRSGSSIFEDEIGEVFAHDASALQQAKPPITGATGKPRCHRASAAVGLATAPIAIVAPTASVARVFFIARLHFFVDVRDRRGLGRLSPHQF